MPNGSPHLTIIVPVYNEEHTIAEIMGRLAAACPEAEIIYVDDGSRDGSLAILRKHARPGDIVLTKTNGGKGSAIREGLRHASGHYTMIQDADLEYDPEEIPLLLAEAERRSAPVLLGSRRLRKHEREYARLRYYIGGNALSVFSNLLFGTRITDVMTCYKLIKTDLFRALPLTCNRFDIETEIVAEVARRGIPIEERGINYHPRPREEGKKINWKDFFRCLWCLLRVRCSPAPRGTPESR